MSTITGLNFAVFLTNVKKEFSTEVITRQERVVEMTNVSALNSVMFLTVLLSFTL